jgi:hypothetical protein
VAQERDQWWAPMNIIMNLSDGTKQLPVWPAVLKTNRPVSHACPHIISISWKIYTVHGTLTHISNPKKQLIIAYFRYVNDIFIIYVQNKANIEQTLKEFDNLKPSIKFTIEKELHEEINFLFLTIHHKDKKLKFSIYVGKSISKLQMDIELKQIRVLIWKMLLLLNIISLYIEALVSSFHKPLKTSSIKFFGLLVFRGLWNDGTSDSVYREIMLRNKSIFQISTLICLSSISIRNLLIDLPQ